jgi:uncharacterized protein YbaR (Trm112 family)
MSDYKIHNMNIRRFSIDPEKTTVGKIIVQGIGGFMSVLLENLNRFNNVMMRDKKLISLLRCPNCKTEDESTLTSSQNSLTCKFCDHLYPKIDGVYLIFEKSLGEKLYPEYL